MRVAAAWEVFHSTGPATDKALSESRCVSEADPRAAGRAHGDRREDLLLTDETT
jgi:hypothetical protein